MRIAGYPAASKTFDSKSEATIWAAKKTIELKTLRKGQVPKKSLRETFEKYIKEVSIRKKGGAWEIKRLNAAFRLIPFIDKTISDVTVNDVILYRDMRLSVVSPSTVVREFTLISSVFEMARRDWRWIDVNIIREVRMPAQSPHRERVIADDEINKMLRSLNYRYGDKPISLNNQVAVCFLLAIETGMRAGELCSLLWDDVFEDYVRLRDGKTGARDVPLSIFCREIIELLRGLNEVKLFDLTPPTLDALFRKARKKADLKGFTFHDSRHTAATRLSLSGKIDVLLLCKMFGWSNTKRALTYFNPTASQIAAKLRG